jgi:glucose-6-phosphate isomerase
MPEVLATRQRMAAFAEASAFRPRRSGIRAANQARGQYRHRRFRSRPEDDGLGLALDQSHPTLRRALRFEPRQRAAGPAAADARSATTLFIVVSKTFTTQETMLNAQTARDWLLANLGDDVAPASHFAAVTSKPERAVEFGVSEDAVFPIWDWVGGRYSLWSAVGLALMIAIGPQAFDELLRGCRAHGRAFPHTPFERNLPVVMALIGIWNTNFLGRDDQCRAALQRIAEVFPVLPAAA